MEAAEREAFGLPYLRPCLIGRRQFVSAFVGPFSSCWSLDPVFTHRCVDRAGHWQRYIRTIKGDYQTIEKRLGKGRRSYGDTRWTMNESKELLTTTQKALTINLDVAMYGTFAEIGAGQEVAREFFHAGGASGTIAKSISAYDMVFSDAIYGKTARYVSRERLKLMLDHEYELLLERLSPIRGDRTTFFVFADTVATSNHQGTNEAHGWLGLRFQTEPMGEPSEIVLHVRMWDKDAVLQQQALGIVGINLIYGALYYRGDPGRLIESLKDNLGVNRIE